MKSVRRTITHSLPWLAVAALVVAGPSCSADSSNPAGPNNLPENPPPEDPSDVVVTEPVLLEAAALSAIGVRSAGRAQLYSNAAEEVSYVSFPPGSQPEADSADVFNRTRDLAVGSPMIDGGLDPIPIPASIGDTLVITTYRDGIILELFARAVPERIPPIVVRTDPPRGKTRVPLNSFIVIVFSEPVDGGTVTPTSVRLRRGTEIVSARLDLAANGLSVQITPETILESSSTYTVAIETELADRIGDTLESQYTTEFTTVPGQLQGELVFESGRTGNKDVWTMKSDGSELFQLTDRIAGGQATGPALSPDGRQVAFSLADPASGDEWDIYVINVDGTGLTNLTNDPGFDGWRPAWSPDGTQIAFFSTRDDPVNDEVYVMNADGSNVRRLTDNPSDDAHMTWSPDGTRIAWETNRAGDFDIWIMNADGSNPTTLTVDPADDEWPAWSPDGTKIAFDTFRDGNREIYTINVDGTGLTNLTNDPGVDSAAAWSHDGTKIAFISDRSGGVDIWVMNADGSNPENLTDDGWADFFPSWSP
jgi:hypothetical protein